MLFIMVYVCILEWFVWILVASAVAEHMTLGFLFGLCRNFAAAKTPAWPPTTASTSSIAIVNVQRRGLSALEAFA